MRAWRAGVCLLAPACWPHARAADPLTQAADILALPSDVAARHQPVALSGVVTASEPDWEGKFFVQDASAGVFVLAPTASRASATA